MSTRSLTLLSALSGIAGPILLALSFIINSAPTPTNGTAAQWAAYNHQHFTTVVWGAWLQSVSPALIVLFALGIVVLAGATTRLAGWMTMFGASTLMTVSLVEVTFYISALESGPAGGPLSEGLIQALQHLYFNVAAPALLLPLGAVILGSTVLPRILGYLGIALGAGFAVLGVAFVASLTLPALVTYAAFLSALWFFVAAVTLLVRTLARTSSERVVGTA